jgi:hypothetical protein
MYLADIIEKTRRIQELKKRQQKMPKITIGKSCEVCGDTVKLQIHHISYSPIEVITVCNPCHSLIHGKTIVFRHQKYDKPLRTIAEMIEEKQRIIGYVSRCRDNLCKSCKETNPANCYKEQLRGEIIELQTRPKDTRQVGQTETKPKS